MHRIHIAYVIHISWKHPARAFAKFIVPDGGDKVDSGTGLTYTGPPGYIGWQARATTTLCRSQLYPPVRVYEFGFREDGLMTEASFFEYYILVARSAAKDAP